MHASEIMARLIEIEKSVGQSNPTLIRAQLMMVEEGLLQLEQLTIEALRENAILRRRMEYVLPPSGQPESRFDA
jgi:hypothetical protein